MAPINFETFVQERKGKFHITLYGFMAEGRSTL